MGDNEVTFLTDAREDDFLPTASESSDSESDAMPPGGATSSSDDDEDDGVTPQLPRQIHKLAGEMRANGERGDSHCVRHAWRSCEGHWRRRCQGDAGVAKVTQRSEQEHNTERTSPCDMSSV